MRKFWSAFNLVLLLFLQVGCSPEADCDIPRQEVLNSSSSLHLLDSTGITWATDPPTSGPHYPIPPNGGYYDFSLSSLEQVAFLESGGVIVQYLPTNNTADIKEMISLASNSVIVSPNKTLDNAVIATAWTWKLSCKKYELNGLREFITEYGGKKLNSHGK